MRLIKCVERNFFILKINNADVFHHNLLSIHCQGRIRWQKNFEKIKSLIHRSNIKYVQR